MGVKLGGFHNGGCGCCAGGPPVLPCSPCNIPKETLTLSYTNILFGNGSTPLLFSSPTWLSACVFGNNFQLSCTGGAIELRGYFYISGSCPTGVSNYCSNLGAPPLQLTLASHTCSPFSLTFTLTSASCPALIQSGWTSFTITYP